MTDAPAPVALLGKHPGWGDFLRHGWPAGVAEGLEGWIDASFGIIRDATAIWDAARPLRFAIGGGLLGTPMAGVMRFSQDRVGRRSPLIVAHLGPIPSPDDQSLWDALEVVELTPGDPLAERFPDIAPSEDIAPVSAVVWALNADGDFDALLSAATQAEPAAAAAARSHWWRVDAPALWLSVPGLPNPEALRFLMGDT